MSKRFAGVLIVALGAASVRAEKLEPWDITAKLEASGFHSRGTFCQNGKCTAYLTDEYSPPKEIPQARKQEASLLAAKFLSGTISPQERDRLLFLLLVQVFGISGNYDPAPLWMPLPGDNCR